jgi:hypothetical protein
MFPRLSEDDRVEIGIGFTFKGKEKGVERHFGQYDDYATIFLEREEIEDNLPEAASLERLLIEEHLRNEELDEQNPYLHIGSRVIPTAHNRDGYKMIVQEKLKQAFTDSTHNNRMDRCHDAVRFILRDDVANEVFKEFVKYDTLQKLVK